MPYEGKYDTYEGDGYVYELRGKLSYLQGNLSLLRDMNWIDRETRAIFAEFAVFNPNINLVMVATILVEFLPSGSIIATSRFDPLNLFNEIGQGFFSLNNVSLVCFALFVIYFFIMEVRKIFSKLHVLKEYTSDFWSYIEWSIIGKRSK